MFSNWRKYFTDKNQDLSLLQLFKPVYYALVVLGLFPNCIKFETKHHCVYVHRTFHLNSFCGVLIIMATATFGVLNAIEDIEDETSIMTTINYIIELLFVATSCIVGYICAYFYRRKIVDILNTLASAWVELPITKNSIFEKLRSQIIVSLFSVMFCLVLHTIVNFTMGDEFFIQIVVQTSFIYPQFIQIVTVTFYCVIVLMLVAVLMNIEEVLKAFGKETQIYWLREGNPRNITLIPPPIDLKIIESVYVKAFRVKGEINDAFQATLLVICMQCLHGIISESHVIYHGLIVEDQLTFHDVAYFVLWIAYQFIKILALAYSGNLLKKRVSNIMVYFR